MSGVALGVAAALAVVRLLGADRRWPWRAAELTAPGRTAPAHAACAADAPPLASAARDLAPARPSAHRTADGLTRRRTPARRRSARQRRRADAALARDLPAAVDMLRVAVTAGHTLHTAVVEVSRLGAGPVAAALAEAVDSFDRGGRLVESIGELPERHGPSLRPLCTTLVVAASSGAPLAPALQRLADAERRRLRRRTEERVRRLPVLLLAPLVGLVLPAFVLLTVVPVGLTTARSGLDLTVVDPAAARPSPSSTAPRGDPP